MSSCLTSSNIKSLEVTAATAAGYLDACDSSTGQVRFDPSYYRCCGNLLTKIFTVVDAGRNFPSLLEHSAAAREVAESIRIGRHIEISRLGYYPELSALLNRISA